MIGIEDNRTCSCLLERRLAVMQVTCTYSVALLLVPLLIVAGDADVRAARRLLHAAGTSYSNSVRDTGDAVSSEVGRFGGSLTQLCTGDLHTATDVYQQMS